MEYAACATPRNHAGGKHKQTHTQGHAGGSLVKQKRVSVFWHTVVAGGE